MKLDIVSRIGQGACQLTDYAGQTFSVSAGCSRTDFEPVGWIALGLVVLLLVAVRHAGRERRRQDNYLL